MRRYVEILLRIEVDRRYFFKRKAVLSADIPQKILREDFLILMQKKAYPIENQFFPKEKQKTLQRFCFKLEVIVRRNLRQEKIRDKK